MRRQFSVEALRRLAPLAAISMLLLAAQPSLAASISYPDQAGDTVVYKNIQETSFTDPVPLFGAPIVTGDSIDFNPVLFNALSQFNTPGVDVTDGHLTFVVEAKAGHAITNMQISEGGVTTVVGAGSGIAERTYTDVTAAGVLEITHVDGVGIDIVELPINLIFSHQPDGTWDLALHGLALTLPWTGNQFFDLNAALDAADVDYVLGATRVILNLDNGLIADSEETSIAFIDKKDFGGLSITVNIPEPSAMILALAGFGIIGLLGRRR
jgi:hypothetical protein